MLLDIRKNIPQTPQTDPNKFPPYSYHAYPKMMTHPVGKKQVPYKDNSGNPVIVNNATEEAEFKASLGEEVAKEPEAKTVSINPLSELTEPKVPEPVEASEPERVKRKYTKRLPADLTS